MIFYHEKFKEIKNRKKVSTNTLSEIMGVHRVTIWNWEKGKKIPTELKIRKLADILDTSINEISDLEPEHGKSDLELSEVIKPWLKFADKDNKEVFGKFNKYMAIIQEQYKKLQKSTVIARALLSSIESLLYIKDKHNKYITANRAFRNTLSLTEQYDIEGKSDIDFFSKKEAIENTAEDNEIIKSGNSIRNVECYIPGTRKKRVGLVSKVPIFDPDKKIIGIIVNYIDVTDRIKASHQRKLLEKAINSIEDCIWIAKKSENATGKIDFLFVNDAIKNGIINTDKNAFNKNNTSCKYEILDKFNIHGLISQKLTDFPKTSEFKDSYSKAEITLREKIFYDERENIFLGIVEDITKNKKNREVRILLEKVLGQSHDIVWIRESPPSNKLLYVSQSVIEMYGYPSEVYYRDTDFWYINCVHPDDRDKLLEYRDSKSWPGRKVHKILTKDKEVRWIETSILKSKFLDKQCVAYIERDVTERIKAEEQLIENRNRNIAEALLAKGVDKNIIAEVTGIGKDKFA